MFELVEYSACQFVSTKIKHTCLRESHEYTQVKDATRSDVANRLRVASAQTAAMPVENSSEVWRQIHVLTSNQNHSYYIQLLQKCTRRSERWIEISQLKITPTCQWATE